MHDNEIWSSYSQLAAAAKTVSFHFRKKHGPFLCLVQMREEKYLESVDDDFLYVHPACLLSAGLIDALQKGSRKCVLPKAGL
jgi:hypothetical protein